MYLKKLEILGFKSFADKISVDFDAGVTAIVGPNGCGKTNIVDAVRWAIGEQKASVLRSSTMENVIFNGTRNRKALSFAEVSLTVENTKGTLPLSEYSEITLTRRCFRDGTSNYLINGTQCRLKDIQSLFMDTGMGSDAYSVIELKMVNEILSPRTQDRRKLFEEASGITKYKERRREALYKLEVARESITEANIEIRNRQRTVNSYEKIAQRRQEANEIAEQLKLIELDYHQRCLSKLINDTKHIEEELKLKENDREQLQEKYIANEKETDSYKEELSGIESHLNAVRERLNDINNEITGITNSISMKQQRINFLAETIERFAKEKLEAEEQIIRLNANKIDIEQKIEDIKNAIQLQENSLAAKKKTYEQTEYRVKVSKDELKDFSMKLNLAAKDLSEKQNEYEITKSKQEDNLNRNERLTKENIAHLNKISELESQRESASDEVLQLKNILSRLAIEYNDAKKLKDNYAAEINRIEKDIIYKTHEAEKLKEKISFQKNLLDTFADYSEGVKYFIKEEPEESLTTVLDNIKVADKFKVAIETALGEISNYLIVSNFEAANRYIQTLKEKDKGKVTFILKDNLCKSTFNIFKEEFPDIIGKEGVYGWADEFAEFPKEYELLYRYLLDEYIIVENYDTAIKLSKDSFIKFITLDGDIITDGFIRAGSRTNTETMKMGREKLITELELKVTAIENEIDDDNEQFNTAKNKHFAVNLDNLEKQIAEIKEKALECDNKIAQHNYQKEQINKLIDTNSEEIDNLNQLNKTLSERIDSLIREVESAETSKYQREKELEHITTELESLADELTAKKDDYNNFVLEITKTKAELSNSEKELNRVTENISARYEIIETRANESETYKLEIERLKAEIAVKDDSLDLTGGMQLKLSELNSEKNSVEADFSLIKAEYDAKRSLIDTLEQNQRILRTQRDNIIEFIHKNEMQITKDRLEIKEHKDRVKEEYDTEIEYTVYENEAAFDFIKIKSEIEKLRIRLKQLGGSGQLELGIFEEEKKQLEKMLEERNDLVRAEEDLINLIDEINKTAQEKFTITFEKIRTNFQAIFRELFLEGDEADIKLVYEPEETDPLNAKIDIMAKPRGKRPQLIDLLSGGEKTLTAIALLFAIYQVKPSPFCILDEVDAPLDDANIDRFVKIIHKFSGDTQFIVVTHNKRTMEAADSMYGVTMAEQGISTIVNVQFNNAVPASVN